MKKTITVLAVVVATLLTASLQSYACTNVIVTKGASKDGSVMVTYSADSHTLFGELYFRPAADWKEGDMRDVVEWDSGKLLGQIPQPAHTYQRVGNMNEHQLIFMETTFGGRPGLENKNAVMEYGSLIYIALERCRTAREAIALVDELTREYGYASEGESFSIADKDECWIMEIVGKGDEKGAVWVAVRIPDGYISGHANQSRIHTFPLNDPENCLYAPDVISFARKKGFFSGKDKDFSFCDAYCPADFGGLRGCEARVWSAFRLLAGKGFDADRYLDFAMGYNTANKMPLYVKPDEKVSVDALAAVMRDHYEDTPMDFREDVGAGLCRTPYRWRPMSFTLDGKTYEFERSIATQQTGFWYLAQARSWLPDEVGGLLWFGVDDAAMSPLTPIYANIITAPECFREGNGSMLEYSPTSAFWLVNRFAQFAYLYYDRVMPEVSARIVEHEGLNQSLVAATDAAAIKLLETGTRDGALALLTEFSASRSDAFFKKWTDLSNYLLVKFKDGNIMKQNPDGSFKDNGNYVAQPEYPDQPEFRERWQRAIVEDHGEVIEVK